MSAGQKDPGALLTIGELSQRLGVAQHILRYWETRFPQLRPMQRAGNRRYYRPGDVALAERINRLLNQEGYSVRGAQKVLGNGHSRNDEKEQPVLQSAIAAAQSVSDPVDSVSPAGIDMFRLIALRDRLAQALRS